MGETQIQSCREGKKKKNSYLTRGLNFDPLFPELCQTQTQ